MDRARAELLLMIDQRSAAGILAARMIHSGYGLAGGSAGTSLPRGSGPQGHAPTDLGDC